MSFHSFLSRAQLNRRLSWTTTTLIGTNLLDQSVDDFFSSDSTFLAGLSDFFFVFGDRLLSCGDLFVELFDCFYDIHRYICTDYAVRRVIYSILCPGHPFPIGSNPLQL